MKSNADILPLAMGFTEQLTEIKQILSMCALPAADISPAKTLLFFGCRSDTKLAGMIGLEVFGSVALLRSLAVAPSQRKHGLGRSLLAFAEAHAASLGVESLYLFTTTAEAFFSKLGYSLAVRSDVPESIKATLQYTELCPASAACMSKRLRPSGATPI